MLIKGFSRVLCHYIVTECRRSISCHYRVNLGCVLVTDRHFHLAIAGDIDSVCDQYFYQFSIVRVNCFHNLSHFVDTKVSKIFGLCNSLPKKNEKKLMKKNLDNSMILVSYHNINSGMTDLRLRQRKLIRSGCRLDNIHWRRLAAREVYGISKLLIISDLSRSPKL